MSVRLEQHGVYLLPHVLWDTDSFVLEAIQDEGQWTLVECHATPYGDPVFKQRATLPPEQWLRYLVGPAGELLEPGGEGVPRHSGLTVQTLSLLGYMRSGGFVPVPEDNNRGYAGDREGVRSGSGSAQTGISLGHGPSTDASGGHLPGMAPPTEVTASAINPWISIWIRPRATMRYILETGPRRHVLLLAALGGFGPTLEQALSGSWGDRWALPVVLVLCAVLGGLFGLLGWVLGGWILRWTGSLLGGRASVEETRAALAWSQAPLIQWTFLKWTLYLGFFGAEMFTTATPRMDVSPATSLFVLLELVGSIVTVWAVVISLKCLGEAHRFSAWRALGALLLPAAIFVPFLCVLGLLVGF